MFLSIKFPVERGYVYWLKAGSNPALAVWGGGGVLPEAASLMATGMMLGVPMNLYFQSGGNSAAPPPGTVPRVPGPAQ